MKLESPPVKGQEPELNDKLASLQQKLKELQSQKQDLTSVQENQEFISRGVLIALIVAILGGFAKLLGLLKKFFIDL
jgi:hypothetical protein